MERVQPPKGVYRYVNRMMVWVLSSQRRSRRLGEHLLLLHVKGRKTGRELTIPVAHHPGPDGHLIVLTSAPWRVNLRGRPRMKLTYRGVLRHAVAELEEDPGAVSQVYRDLIVALGPGKASQRMGIRIAVDRVPALEELREASTRDGLSVIDLTLED